MFCVFYIVLQRPPGERTFWTIVHRRDICKNRTLAAFLGFRFLAMMIN
jgi:hypothetical protein